MAATSESIVQFFLPVLGMFFFIGLGVIALNFSFQTNLRKQIQEKEELKARHQEELLRSVIESQEEESKRIAIDIHDEIGALLNASRFNVSQLGITAKTPENQKIFDDIFDLYGKISTNIRRIAHGLRPVVLEKFGLVSALEEFQELLEGPGLKLQVISSISSTLPDKLELALYRIFQELISNTLKHANATTVKITLQEHPDGFNFYYEDNGIGFSPDQVKSGLGLRGIESRLSIFGGTATYLPVEKGVLFQMELKKHLLIRHDSHSTGR